MYLIYDSKQYNVGAASHIIISRINEQSIEFKYQFDNMTGNHFDNLYSFYINNYKQEFEVSDDLGILTKVIFANNELSSDYVRSEGLTNYYKTEIVLKKVIENKHITPLSKKRYPRN